MITDEDFAQALVTARAHLEKIVPYLPTQVAVEEIGVWSVSPYKALVVRGGLLWRSQELGADAIRAFKEGRLATAIILTRAVIENVALHWRLGEVITKRAERSPKELSETLTRMIVGWKNDEEFPVAFNVLGMIDHLDKHLPGVRNSYDQLSEIAHPNYGGVHGLYAENDESNFLTNLGPKVRSALPRHSVLILAATLGVQINADVQFSDALKEWIATLPSLDQPRPDDETWWEPKTVA
ncbi:MAG: hypothetical protein WC563_14980 [Brevundimonas sp.]|jgi:hypothetical protein